MGMIFVDRYSQLLPHVDVQHLVITHHHLDCVRHLWTGLALVVHDAPFERDDDRL